MRAGLSTIQQTLTPEAASVLNHSIAEAGRRNHGQTTPLHVAATLLASPSGYLRQACIKSHPNSSHPLQCRALELCFSVALERLPTSQNASSTSAMEPPISNALMAALKRAQAHQRRGYPEQQQQPLLAVKVELEQLIISILDDPSVSRVMREASFSSPAVKATIEQSLNSVAPSPVTVNSNPMMGFRPGMVTPGAAPTRNLYMNPRLQQQGGAAALSGAHKGDEVKRVVEILMRTKKRNPVLVGESEPEAAIREVLKKIENKELGEGVFSNAHAIYLEKELPSDRGQIPVRIKELGDLIESRLGNSGSCGGVFINLGDLKWLVEQPVGFGLGNMQQPALAEAGRAAVAEMGRLVAKFGEGGVGKLWLLGTATCETYLRCQVYHPSMENDWDLQAVPITTRSPLPGMFPRLGTNGILGTTLESLSPLKTLTPTPITPLTRASENVDPAAAAAPTCCPQCMRSCEQEIADMLKETEKSDSELKPDATRPPLPQWLQNARTNNDNAKVMDQAQSNGQEGNVKKRTQEIQKKWHDSCLNLHPKFHQQNVSTERIVPTPFSMTNLYNVNLLGRQFQPKVQPNKNLGCSLQLSSIPIPIQQSEHTASPRKSTVTTELVLGQTKPSDTIPEESHRERINDFLSSLSSESQDKFDELHSKKLFDTDSFKRLLKTLTEKVWWQQDAASAIATAVTQCKLGNGKRRSKGDTWLMFTGPDRIGKKRMAAALSELVSGSNPIVISLAQRRGDGDSNAHQFRGKTVLDRIVETIRRNPHSVIMLEDIDEANTLLRGNIKRAMEQGRFPDSHGREISLGNVMFILTSNWLPEDLSYLSNGAPLDDEKLENLASGGWQLRLSVTKKVSKRRPSWLSNEERSLKPRKELNLGLSFDLNEAADVEEDRADGSHNSSDFTVDHEENNHNGGSPSKPRELLDSVDDAIVFKPLNFDLIRQNFSASIAKRFSAVVGNGISIEVQEEALDKITSGVWLGQTTIDEWMEKVLVPSFHQLNKSYNSSNLDEHESSLLVRLEDDGYSDRRSSQELLPASVRVAAE
ncbi:putative P-loop containing nucleoside triphosphate hydrolase [Medicago truncatula]|uniref:Putative P-loop containing nucleoside triphosphate hydrolase n=1 Tax=Medicago truncatula TaxID=3880 RepID=A0A396IIW2_MEDTR|nr:protein SUPPRESSOR OF MAX2 1 [Medicago truncatula]RHN64801.1 putative P-loop containing nucleoside triphosphate hydrolase [Medicago truncatula]